VLIMAERTYTKPELRARIKSQVMASGDGGKPGQWSARKAQLVSQKYEAAGGGYKGPRTGAQKSLAKWTDQKWTTSDGKPAEKPDGTMRRYLPEKAWDKLTPGQKAATNKKKVEASRKGQQFVANTDAAQDARAKVSSAANAMLAALDPNIFNGFAQQLAEAINEKRASERLKDPEGGLTAAGRRHYEQSGESKDLKPGVKKPVSEMSTKDMKRKGSWARRFYGQSPLPPLKKPNGEPTRLALTARAWGEPVPQNEQQARAIAAKGARLLEMAKRREGEKSSAVEPNVFTSFAQNAIEAAAREASPETDDLDPNSAYMDSALHKATGAERSRMNPVDTPSRADYARPPARSLRSV
jgi:hypothetical protein